MPSIFKRFKAAVGRVLGTAFGMTEQTARNLRNWLSGNSPGMWASDHWEESRHLTGWNFCAIRAIAQACAQAEVSAFITGPPKKKDETRKVRRKRLRRKSADAQNANKPNRRPLPDHHGILRLMHRPNPMQSGASLRFQMAQQVQLTGTALVWVRLNSLGIPVEVYVVPTAVATPQAPTYQYPHGSYIITPLAAFPAWLDAQGFAIGGALTNMFITGGVIDAREMVIIRWPHPLYLSDGLSPLTAGSMAVDVAEQLDRARWYDFKNAPNPGMVLTTDETATPSPEAMNAFREDLRARNAGTQNTGKDMLLPPGVVPNQIRHTPDEMGYVASHPQVRDAVLALHRTPPVAIGINEAGNYSAYYASLKQFTDLAVQPLLDLIGEEFTIQLAWRYHKALGLPEHDQIEVKFKAKGIDDPTIKQQQLQTHLKAMAITVDEYRSMVGLPPHPDKEYGKQTAGISQRMTGKDNDPDSPGFGNAAPEHASGGKPADGEKPGNKPPDKGSTGIRNPGKDAVPGRSTTLGKPTPKSRMVVKSAGPHKYASTQFNVPAELADKLTAFANKIPFRDLDEDGASDEPHITARYGLHETNGVAL